MKIALFEPSPRTCGPVRSAFETRNGFRTLGHEADVVTFTKSGRSRKHWGPTNEKLSTNHGFGWWYEAPDVVVKWQACEEVFNGYDLVILTEPKCAPLDREAKKENYTRPRYIEALARTTTPWTTCIFAPQYDERRAPYMEDLLQTGNFTGKIITHTPHKNERFAGVEMIEHLAVPYTPVNPIEAPVPTNQVIGLPGRIVPNKGPQVLAYLADEELLPKGWDVEIWGASAVMLGPAFTHIMWEALNAQGWSGVHSGYEHDPRPVRRPYTWYVEKADRRISYRGNYSDAVEVCSRFGVAVNLTDQGFSGVVEWAQLEALDAGCVCVFPVRFGLSGDFSFYALEKFIKPAGLTTKHKDGSPPTIKHLEAAVEEELVKQINAAAELRGTVQHQQLAMHNREMLLYYNSPARFAQRIIDEVIL